MKKLFLIPLMAMLCTVMAWGEAYEVNSFSALKNAIEQGNYPEVKLTADDIIRSTSANSCINITRSVTIDGDNHSITGYACRADNTTNGTLIAINHNGTDSVDVIIKNLTLNDEKLRAIETRGLIRSLTLENCTIKATKSSGYQQPITIGGDQSSAAEINIINSKIEALKYYPIITFNPIILTITDSRIDGWCSVYFKGPNSSAGAHGSTVVATNSYFNAQNYNTGLTNTFGAFVLEDDDVNIVLDNCVVDVTAHDGTLVAAQALFVLSDWATDPSLQCRMTIKGSNSHVIGDFILDDWDASVPVQLELQGGSYYGDDFETAIAYDQVSVASGYHAELVSQGGQEMYRIVKDAAVNPETSTLYDLNDNVEGDGSGENPVTSFELSTGTNMTLNNDTTKAGYVQIKDNGTTPTTVTVGQTASGDDQTLIINEGLDVQGNSQVIVEAGATLQIGEGGIVTSKPENIVIEADENGAASMIMDPAITVNTMPNLTVKMKAKNIGWLNGASGKEYFWHRFALPIQQATSWVKNPNKSTYVFGWNYSTNDWEQYGALTQMVPFKGYTLTADTMCADIDHLAEIEYTFTGQLAGNQNRKLQFERNGFNFFGNSYTGYIDILALVEQIMGEAKIDGTVWMWNQSEQKYESVPLQALRDTPNEFEDWKKEVAPMQTFIMKQNGGVNASTELNYASAIWGNPRYGHNNSSAQTAPQRIQDNATARMRIIVTAENGKSDYVMFTEENRFSDAFEKGYDGEKYMNENTLNMYATVNDVNYSAVATDNLAGKALTLNTVASVNYTMTFAKVHGETYAIRDLMTNIVTPMTEGNTYTFAAQPNTTIEGRFVIVPMQNMPTDVETVENTTAAKGIYTVMGQYVGEDFESLPAGMYIVNGVKIVK